MHITVMRGIHDIGMVDDIVKYAKDADVIFLEALGTQEVRSKLERTLNGISFDEGYTDNLNATEMETISNYYIRIAWRLRGQRKIYALVDVVTDDPNSYADKVTPISDTLKGELYKTLDYKAFYDGVDKRLNVGAASLIGRDVLVVKQVRAKLEWIRTHLKSTHENIVLIQGRLHNTKDRLKKALPDANIDEVIYNQSSGLVVANDPLVQALWHKRSAPDEPVARGAVDRCMVAEASADKISAAIPDDVLTAWSHLNRLSEDPYTIAYVAQLDALAKLSDKEVHKTFIDIVHTKRRELKE